ncbi:MAG: RNA polymerase sigma factor WhiG, partial [Nitrospirae bacterium]|nr:RNA polymerase sigma factor WhiG [Candidatus Troglogloeales bacterium]
MEAIGTKRAMPSHRIAMPEKMPDTEGYEKWVTEFAPLIRFLAHRLAFRLPPYLDVDDLMNAGVIGLM